MSVRIQVLGLLCRCSCSLSRDKYWSRDLWSGIRIQLSIQKIKVSDADKTGLGMARNANQAPEKIREEIII